MWAQWGAELGENSHQTTDPALDAVSQAPRPPSEPAQTACTPAPHQPEAYPLFRVFLVVNVMLLYGSLAGTEPCTEQSENKMRGNC